MTPEELSAAKERANQKRRLRRLWVSDASIEEVCEEMGMAAPDLLRYAASLGLTDRKEPGCYIPTPLEIKIATAQIRMAWTQPEREARLGRIDNATRSDN